MKIGWFTQLFPPPQFLTAPVIGLDISDRSAKFSCLGLTSEGLRVKHFGEITIPLGLIESGRICDTKKLAEALRPLVASFPSRLVMASLPEEQAYVIKLELPNMAESDLRGSIELQLEEHVPIRAAEAIFDYEIIAGATTRDRQQLSTTILPKNIVADYLTVIETAGLQPLAFEVEAQAITRAVIPRGEKLTCLVIDFGKTRTSFFVARGESILFTSTVKGVGGEDLNKAIQKQLGVNYEVAEKLKIERGLLTSREYPHLDQAILPIISVLRDETATVYDYWRIHANEHDSEGQPIRQITLCGGQATLPGLVEYLGAKFEVPVRIADVWVNILDRRRSVPPIRYNDSFKYATSLGLALRPFPSKI